MRNLLFYSVILTIIFTSFSVHANDYAANSVLSSGKWFKIGVLHDGIYKLTYQDLDEMGFTGSAIQSSSIRIYGNGGRMLSEDLTTPTPDDLLENAIYVNDNGDGVFNSNDYILFYAQGTTDWSYNDAGGYYNHQSNLYTDTSFYFVSIQNGNGLRVEDAEIINYTEDKIVNHYYNLLVHDSSQHNLIGSGRKWFGEKFDFETEYDFSFSTPNALSSGHTIRTGLAARAENAARFDVTAGNTSYTHYISPVSYEENSNYANTNYLTQDLSFSGSNIQVKVANQDLSGYTIGWLDYIELHIKSALNLTNSELLFRTLPENTDGQIIKYQLNSSFDNISIWDVSNPQQAKNIQYTKSGNTYSFIHNNNIEDEFVAFKGSSFPSPILLQSVQNQNLHNLRDIDYVIITIPEYFDEAIRLADFHYNESDLAYTVVSTEEIYNEFSSGGQDVSAIRNYLRMLYESRSTDNLLQVLLFGDGSYDYKNILDNNTNIVPTWQSSESVHPINSYASDDFFAFLNTAKSEVDIIDIGIGRIPVSTKEAAAEMVDKIINYCSNDENFAGDWRNVICFVADDEDSNSHTSRANQLAGYVDSFYPCYNIDKIYIDTYEQVSNPSGQRYPDANQAIENMIKKGALIVNYTGHGGEEGWAKERIIHVSDINGWNNDDRYPVFVTATCEFSRFDDPTRTSAGEYVLLNPSGGGVALFTTTRATYGSPNQNLNLGFYKYALTKDENGMHYRLGDLIHHSKREIDGDFNARKFVLLGDPAMRMSYPTHQVHTTKILNLSTNIESDTLRALQEILIEGEIRNDGQILSSFNGEIFIKIYDKEAEVETRGNDNTQPYTYTVRKSILYSGTASVTNGKFSQIFIVPKDIAYKYGNGKISYYATGDQGDAAGFDKSIIIGGFGENVNQDLDGPIVNMYMNDPFFENGGITDENPVFYAEIEDESGINTIGTGIGHDIRLIVNDGQEDIVINDFYKAESGNYKKGNINYPFYDLTGGKYKLQLRIWDNNNNSTTATLNFEVYNADTLKINNAYSYPNPFINETRIVFEHNQSEIDLDLQIDIFDIYGKLVRTLKQKSNTIGYVSEPVIWDGCNRYGRKLGSGIYVYRIRVQNSSGLNNTISRKLVLVQ